MGKFKVGDRVTARDNLGVHSNGKGIIAEDDGRETSEQRYMVRFDDDGKRYWCYTDSVKPFVENKIVITTDGSATLARLYDGDKVVKSKEAKCAPSDTYDFSVGARLAFDRLMGEDKPASKYDAMSNDDLNRQLCNGKSRSRWGITRKDCPSREACHSGHGSEYVITHRAEVIAYLIAEDAAKAERETPKPEPEKKPEPEEPVKLYCVKDCNRQFRATKGKTYELLSNGDMQFDNELAHSTGDDTWEKFCRYNRPYKEYFIPLVRRPAKVGEWVYVANDDELFCFGRKKGDIVFIDGKQEKPDREGFIWGSGLGFDSNDYFVLDGYSPADALSDYEWIDGVKGMDRDMQCRDFQYAIGGEYDLGEAERNGSKGFHFCDTIEAVKSGTVYSRTDSRYFKVRGLVKKGSTAPIFCARKIQIVEEIVEPKYYNGKVVCVEAVTDLTTGKVYKCVNGYFKDDIGDLRPMNKPAATSLADLNAKVMGKFIEYKGEANV